MTHLILALFAAASAVNVLAMVALIAEALRRSWTPIELVGRVREAIGTPLACAALITLAGASLLGDELARTDQLAVGVLTFGCAGAAAPALGAGTRFARASRALGVVFVAVGALLWGATR